MLANPKVKMKKVIANEKELLNWAKVELAKEGVGDFSNLSINSKNKIVVIKCDDWKIELGTGLRQGYSFKFREVLHRATEPAIYESDGRIGYFNHGKARQFPEYFTRQDWRNGKDKYISLTYVLDEFQFEIVKDSSNSFISLKKYYQHVLDTSQAKVIVNHLLSNYNMTLVELLTHPHKEVRSVAELSTKE